MSKEFWITEHVEIDKPFEAFVMLTEPKDEPSIHVIEYSAYEKSQAALAVSQAQLDVSISAIAKLGLIIKSRDEQLAIAKQAIGHIAQVAPRVSQDVDNVKRFVVYTALKAIEDIQKLSEGGVDE